MGPDPHLGFPPHSFGSHPIFRAFTPHFWGPIPYSGLPPHIGVLPHTLGSCPTLWGPGSHPTDAAPSRHTFGVTLQVVLLPFCNAAPTPKPKCGASSPHIWVPKPHNPHLGSLHPILGSPNPITHIWGPFTPHLGSPNPITHIWGPFTPHWGPQTP